MQNSGKDMEEILQKLDEIARLSAEIRQIAEQHECSPEPPVEPPYLLYT